MRHGKAESFADEDHHRRLTVRGRGEARDGGEWLARQGIVPTHALVSSATRTTESWEALVEGSGCAIAPLVEDAVYSADAHTAMDLLRTVPEGAEVVLYLGHNPTAASLAQLLDDGNPEPEAFRAMSSGFPAGALAVLEVGVPWSDLEEATGHLVAFHGERG
jgi:phosphohistidine phosphatase